ncbi:MAG: hypothetical protein J6J15_09410 [Oscillospiraceae bacterium]|nr:hypothetical protein [Oscillospiraceae bacterium]
MKVSFFKIFAAVLAIFIIGYAGFQAWTFLYNPYKTEIAVTYSVNEALHVNGIAVRTETVIEDQYGGSVSYIHEDAERVLKNKPVAYAHASADTVQKMERAAELQKEISHLEEASAGVSQLYGSSEFINDQIGNSVLAYSYLIASGNYDEFVTTKNDLLLSINKKTTITGGENKFSERIALLKAEYDELQTEINSDEANTVTSPKTGYFISSVDGFENVINKENLFEKSVSEIEKIIDTDVITVDEKIGKIADNYKWFYVISVTPEEAEQFKIGKNVTANFDGINDSVKLEVYEKIEDETSENVIVVLLCKTFTAEVASIRQINADIIFSTISGLRISSDSVRFDENQQMGVFILDRNEVKFRAIEIVHTGNGYNIVKWNQGTKNALQLFDEVFVGGSDLYAGKIID